MARRSDEAARAKPLDFRRARARRVAATAAARARRATHRSRGARGVPHSLPGLVDRTCAPATTRAFVILNSLYTVCIVIAVLVNLTEYAHWRQLYRSLLAQRINGSRILMAKALR